MAIPWIDLSNVTKWLAGSGSGTSGDPYVPAVTIGAPSASTMSSAIISINGSGDTTLVAGVSGQTVRVHKFVISYAASPVTVLVKDGSTTLLTVPLNTYGAIVLEFDGEPWFVTSADNGLVLNLSSSVQIYGRIYYTQG